MFGCRFSIPGVSMRKLSSSNKCILVVVVVCLPCFDFLDNARVFILSEFNKRLVIVDFPTPDCPTSKEL